MKLHRYLAALALPIALLTTSCIEEPYKENPKGRGCYVEKENNTAIESTTNAGSTIPLKINIGSNSSKSWEELLDIKIEKGEKNRHEHRGLEWFLDDIHLVRSSISERKKLSDITIAVLDTGVAYEDYKDPKTGIEYKKSADLMKTKFVQGYDFINHDDHPNDDNQHGTFMTTVIAANGGTLGVASGVKIMPVKVLDKNRAGTELALIEGINYAVQHGADIINMSLAFPTDYEPSQTLQNAIRNARNNGVILVAPSGNGDLKGNGQNTINYPAKFLGVISVGAYRLTKMPGTERLERELSRYSNYGEGISLYAPGGALDQDINDDGHPDGILAMTTHPTDPKKLGYWFQVGTSPSAAIVSGVAARLLAKECPRGRIYEVLRATPNNLDGVPVVDFLASVEKIKEYKLAQK